MKTLIVRKVIDGEEMVCLAPWFYEELIELLKSVQMVSRGD